MSYVYTLTMVIAMYMHRWSSVATTLWPKDQLDGWVIDGGWDEEQMRKMRIILKAGVCLYTAQSGRFRSCPFRS